MLILSDLKIGRNRRDNKSGILKFEKSNYYAEKQIYFSFSCIFDDYYPNASICLTSSYISTCEYKKRSLKLRFLI